MEKIGLPVHPVCRPTFRYEESCVVEVRESVAVVAFSFPLLVTLLTDDQSCEGAIHCVVGHLVRREDGCSNRESVISTAA